MNCEDVQPLLHAYVDGEVDLVRSLQIEEHRTGCEACERQVTGLKELRDVVTRNSLYFHSPAALRAKVQNDLPRVQRKPSPLQTWARLAAAIVLLIGVAGSAIALTLWMRTIGDDRLANMILASHVRSLQVAHLTDVISTDRHTVKPWFVGKIDYSPEIVDLSSQGYVLVGGRLDYLDGRAVAAVVYKRRQHVINLFLWPDSEDQSTEFRPLVRQGFHLRYWRQAGMTYWAISDLNEPELDEFVRLIRAPAQGH